MVVKRVVITRKVQNGHTVSRKKVVTVKRRWDWERRTNGSTWRLNGPAPERTAPPTVEGSGHGDLLGAQSSLKAPMPGVVIRVLAEEGDRVEPRQPLVVLEAMKMETPLVSPYEAVVRRVHVAEGERVEGGALLVELEE